ncbi:histidinol dehydrogenase [Rhizobium sp. 25PS6]|uniref:Histidinol dehydrogenase n=3 Tax=Rhizobium TaxID=379 RepID=A0A432N9S0_9HYPH|nr:MULTISPECIES: histidinol dehydrogenase [Rhizobium]MBA1345311.1 histidinol dehydrogenase [Rhizobium sp. WYCCWR 11146]MDR9764349.1 histidinol dehydrogenase [Rhizobium redzepovicii]MDR9776330.1 histidinol dehydrogenase [Rhizobium hidalgonense]MDR9785461.1 histidinol dehydrogenase [Rhizobium redzepovicii]MDR9814659.1 histidinol dehydrogenase [Rhizobium hidalgonense]
MTPRLEALKGKFVQLKQPTRDAVSDTAQVETTVKEIIANVRKRGDAAVREYSLAFDKADVANFEVTEEEKLKAVADLDPQTREDTEFAIANVRRFAEAQLGTILPLEIESLPGLHLGHRVIPIETVGCYVPGGRYPLLSAPVMTIVPAKVAGCDQVIACLPPNAHPAMIAGCHLAGADRIFRVGGAQAIAAMAYGTETIPAVDKIVGPGNAFVNEAKRQVFGQVGIDQLAGPSEIFVVADETANAVTIATDLLAQAEHDVRTRVGVVTTDRKLAEDILSEVHNQLETLPTAPVAAVAWKDYGEITVVEDEEAMIAYSDHIATEHLQVHTRDPQATAQKLRNYGSIFIGELASVVYSDKCCGTNHTLPTMGAGRYTGGLWVGSYVKIATHQWLDERGVAAVAPAAVRQSATEKLEGHRRAAALRLRPKQLAAE